MAEESNVIGMPESPKPKRKLTKKQIVITVTAAVLIVALVLSLTLVFTLRDRGSEDKLPSMIKASSIAYLDEIQDKENLYFEWLRPYSSQKPTAIIIHGETTGKGTEKFTMDLDAAEYTFKKSNESTTDYVVAENIGYKAQGLNLALSNYWLSVSGWNVAVFHWERFADEENPEDLLSKLFSVPKMRYSDGNGGYETTRVPRNSLTEVFVSLYLEEMKEKLSGNEIRFIGNGVGADLALSAAHYMALYVNDGQIEKNYLPLRMALCDPYLSVDNMFLASDKIPWAEISTTEGMMSVANEMLSVVAGYGAAVEMIESKEISTRQVIVDGSTTTQNVAKYAYDIEKSEKAEVVFKKLKEKLTYLEFRESYSVKFSDEYMKLKRIALDWYLYSIIGSDDSGNAGNTYASGYPRSLSDFQTYYNYSGFNWAPNETRPLMNNRQLNNDSSSTAPSSRGRNFGLSAWTPTVYTRALRGISFSMQKYLTKTTKTTVHGNSVFTFSDYTMPLFRSENFQLSDQSDYTLVCGYVYADTNGDSFMNDGYNGIADAFITVNITTGSGDSTKKVSSFFVTTDSTGFYVIRLNDKVVDSEGNASKSGYAFSTSHTITLDFVPNSHNYYQIASAVSGVSYVTMNGHNFNKYNASVTMSSYYANAITISNCLVRLSDAE